MKRIAKAALNKIVVPAVRHVVEQVSPPLLRHTVHDEISLRVAKECADYAEKHMSRALHFGNKSLLLDHAIDQRNIEGLALEFGVADGNSINDIAKKIAPQTIYGFDSFEGLHVDWAGAGLPKGTFNRNGKPPKVEKNVELVKGWFDKTIQPFIAKHREPIGFAHIDCDTYEATKIVLNAVTPALVRGSVLVIDDYFGYRGRKIGGHKAWQETGLKYKYLGFEAFAASIRLV